MVVLLKFYLRPWIKIQRKGLGRANTAPEAYRVASVEVEFVGQASYRVKKSLVIGHFPFLICHSRNKTEGSNGK